MGCSDLVECLAILNEFDDTVTPKALVVTLQPVPDKICWFARIDGFLPPFAVGNLGAFPQVMAVLIDDDVTMAIEMYVPIVTYDG